MYRKRGKEYKVRRIAEELGGELQGDGDLTITGVAALDDAGPADLSFFSNPSYADRLKSTNAGVVIVPPEAPESGKTLIIMDNPYPGFARALNLFYERKSEFTGIEPGASVGEGCAINDTAAVYGGVNVGNRVTVKKGAVLMPGCYVGDGAEIGENTWLYPNVTVYHGCRLGNNVTIHSGTVVGSDGFGFAYDGGRHHKIPQIGSFIVEADVEIGANVCIDRGTLKDTVIGKGTKIDNLVQIAHNVTVGEGSLLVAQSGISGSTRLGKGVIMAGQSGAVGHINIGEGSRIGAKSAVTKSIEDGSFVTGFPAEEHRRWLKAQGLIRKLPRLRERIGRLERELAKLKK